MPAPTFDLERAETTWNTGLALTKVSSAFTPSNNSVLVAMFAASDTTGGGTPMTTFAFSGGSLTWTQRAFALHTGTGCPIQASTAPVTTGASMTVTGTMNATGPPDWGFDVLEWSSYTAVGNAVANAAVTTNTPSIAITTTAANSAIMLLLADWGANAWTARTWLQPSGSSAFVETATAQTVSGQYSTVGGYYPDMGAAGAKTIGLSAPTTGTWSMAAVEITGTGTTAPVPVRRRQIVPVMRAAGW